MPEMWSWKCECGETARTMRPFVPTKQPGPAPLPDGWTMEASTTYCRRCSGGDQQVLQLSGRTE